MLDERDLNAQVALRQAVHDATYRTERTNKAATESNRSESCDEQPRQSPGGDPDGAGEQEPGNTLGMDPGRDREQLSASSIPAGIGELPQFGRTRRFRPLVFEVTAA